MSQSYGPRRASWMRAFGSQHMVMVLTIVLVVSIFARGVFGLVPSFGLTIATVITDGVVCVMITFVLVALVRRRPRIDPWLAIPIAGFVLAQLLLLPFGEETIVDKLLRIRDTSVYGLSAVYIASYANASTARFIVRIVRWLGLTIAAFGIIQFALRGVLPIWALKPADAAVFRYFGTDIIRANGLVGNTIVYSALLLLCFCLWVATATSIGRWNIARIGSIAAAGAIGVAIVLTFSRTTIALAVVSAIAIIILTSIRAGRSAIRRAAIIGGSGIALVAGVVLLVPTVRNRLLSSFLVQDLFGGANATVAGSTDGHVRFTELAWRAVLKNPVGGLGLGTQSEGSHYAQTHIVITDGALLAILAEGGIFLLAIALAVFLLLTIRAFARWWGADPLSGSAALACGVFIVVQFFVASTVNSAFFGKPPFVVFWVCLGAAMAVARPRVDEVAPSGKGGPGSDFPTTSDDISASRSV